MDNLESASSFIFYTSNDGNVKVQVIIDSEHETVWTTQAGMAELFNTTKQNISLHLQKIFESNELEEISVVKENLTTASDNKVYRIKFYNLDAIIAIGYKVNSYSATQFRKWSTKILKEYLIKGFSINYLAAELSRY